MASEGAALTGFESFGLGSGAAAGAEAGVSSVGSFLGGTVLRGAGLAGASVSVEPNVRPALLTDSRIRALRFRLLMPALRTGDGYRFCFGRRHLKATYRPRLLGAIRESSKSECRLDYRRPAVAGLAGSMPRAPSPLGVGWAVGATLSGLISLLPTKVTPSSIESRGARMSPKSLCLGLDVDLFLGDDVPGDFAAHHYVADVQVALHDRVITEVKRPSVLISPSSLPSNVSSPENRRVPLSSTSELRTSSSSIEYCSC